MDEISDSIVFGPGRMRAGTSHVGIRGADCAEVARRQIVFLACLEIRDSHEKLKREKDKMQSSTLLFFDEGSAICLNCVGRTRTTVVVRILDAANLWRTGLATEEKSRLLAIFRQRWCVRLLGCHLGIYRGNFDEKAIVLATVKYQVVSYDAVVI
jgi:hypothetical protein